MVPFVVCSTTSLVVVFTLCGSVAYCMVLYPVLEHALLGLCFSEGRADHSSFMFRGRWIVHVSPQLFLTLLRNILRNCELGLGVPGRSATLKKRGGGTGLILSKSN